MRPLNGPAIRKLGKYLAQQPGGARLLWKAAAELGQVRGPFPGDCEEQEDEPEGERTEKGENGDPR